MTSGIWGGDNKIYVYFFKEGKMRKIVYQAKKSLSAILAAAMVFTAPVNVMADEIAETNDVVSVFDEVETFEEVEEAVLGEEPEFDGHVGGVCSFNPGPGSFDADMLTRVFVGEDEKVVHGEINAYSTYTMISGNKALDEKDKIIDNEGKLKTDVNLKASLYYGYFKDESNGVCSICVNNWENIIPVMEGYYFTGWYEADENGWPDYSKPLVENKMSVEECVDKDYVAGWMMERYLPNIYKSDVRVEKMDNKGIKTTLTIDPYVFECYDPMTEDLYVMRWFGTDKPNEVWNWGPKTDSPDGWFWHWTRWGDGDWCTPIKPGTEEIEIIGELYKAPVEEVVNVAVTLQYFTCEKGAGGLSDSDMNQEVIKAHSRSAYRVDTRLVPKADFSAALSERFFEYSGKEVKPKVTVRDGSTALKENVDYAVAYKDNLDAGTGMAIVSGKGAYEDVLKELEFFIKKKKLETKNIKIVFSKAGNKGIVDVYNGKDIISRDQYVATLEGNDITDIKDADIYEVKVTFNNDSKILRNYILDGVEDKKTISQKFQSGKVEKDFATAFTVEFDDETVSKNGIEYTGKALKPAVKIIDKATNDKAATKYYTVTYKDNTNAGTATVKVTGRGGYIGSIEKEFIINQKGITNIQVFGIPDNLSYVYSGKENKPKPKKVTATVNGKVVSLANGKDYSLSYYDNVNAGTGSVEVSFDNYKTPDGGRIDPISKTFTITPAPINSVKISGDLYQGVEYTTANTPLTVKAGGVTLTKNDYKVEKYSKDGKLYITVIATGANFKDKELGKGMTVNKKLTKENIKNMNDTYKRVIYYGESYSLSGNYLSSKSDSARLQRSGAIVTGDIDNQGSYIDVTKLAIGKSVSIKWSVSRNDARYTGTKTINVKYAAKNIADDNVGLVKYEISSNAIPKQSYTGKNITFTKEKLAEWLKNTEAIDKYQIAEILKTENSNISYTNNKKTSTSTKPAYVVIKGKGKFTGTVKIPFIIE